MRLNGRMWVALVCGLALGCGDDDEGGGGGGGNVGASYAEIADTIANPTGTLEAGNTVGVAEAYEEILSNAAGGSRIKQSSQTQTEACEAGGETVTSASGNQSNAHVVIDYNDCCFEADCCVNGNADFYLAAEAGSAYSQCGSYDVVASCGEGDAHITYQGCMGADGTMTYVVEYEGKTYSVSGSYYDGNGTLTITDSVTTWTCTYSGGTGSCSSDTGESLNF